VRLSLFLERIVYVMSTKLHPSLIKKNNTYTHTYINIHIYFEMRKNTCIVDNVLHL